MRHIRRFAVVAASLTLAGTLTACAAETAEPARSAGGESVAVPSEPSVDPAVHNDADTEFAQRMILHHEGAIEMAELAATNAANAEVRSLGERIAAAQGPEIELMTSWLQAWGEELSETDTAEMDHGTMDMEGMDQEAVMAELSGLTGADFDRRFLELMTDHHRGAIAMAEQHRSEGRSAEAILLSGEIIDAQTAEITEMANILQDL